MIKMGTKPWLSIDSDQRSVVIPPVQTLDAFSHPPFKGGLFEPKHLKTNMNYGVPLLMKEGTGVVGTRGFD